MRSRNNSFTSLSYNQVGSHVLLLGQYKQRLRKAVTKLTNDIDSVDDIVQETFARTIQSTKSSQITAPFPYLLQVARTVIYEQWKKTHVAEYDETYDVIDPQPSPELRNVHQQKIIAVQHLLTSMPPLRKHVFELRRLHGLSRNDIAKKLNISEDAVKKHINRAMVDVTLLSESH